MQSAHMSQTPQKLSGAKDVHFFSVGSLGGRTLVIYMKKKGVRGRIQLASERGADGGVDGQRVPGARARRGAHQRAHARADVARLALRLQGAALGLVPDVPRILPAVGELRPRVP
jgi:hypothetical protein